MSVGAKVIYCVVNGESKPQIFIKNEPVNLKNAVKCKTGQSFNGTYL